MPGVGAVTLGALLSPPQGCALRRLGEMHPGAERVQLLDNEPPAGCGFQPNLELLTFKPGEKPPDADAVCGRHSRPRVLTGRGVDPVGGDLCSVLVKSHYD